MTRVVLRTREEQGLARTAGKKGERGHIPDFASFSHLFSRAVGKLILNGAISRDSPDESKGLVGRSVGRSVGTRRMAV